MSGPSELSNEDYEELLKPLAEELSTMARWIWETKQRMVVVFEGRDTAGKGGSIEMFSRLLNPRQCRVVALPSPSEREKTQWYFQRYIEHLPAAGEIVLFDRSWYNRAGVERVMGFCTADQTQDFLNAAPEFERHLVDDGMLLFKYWLCCDQEVQEERFLHRLNSPTKRWKLSPIDLKARELYDQYTEARELMLSATHTDFAPWATAAKGQKQRKKRGPAVRTAGPFLWSNSGPAIGFKRTIGRTGLCKQPGGRVGCETMFNRVGLKLGQRDMVTAR